MDGKGQANLILRQLTEREMTNDKTHRIFTVYIDTSELFLHHVCVYLAHVAAAVGLLDLSYVQLPCTVVVVCDANPGIVRHHPRVETEYRLVVRSKPSDLQIQHTGNDSNYFGENNIINHMAVTFISYLLFSSRFNMKLIPHEILRI